MRVPGVAAVVLCVPLSGACASTGAVPRPFPSPRPGSPPAAAVIPPGTEPAAVSASDVPASFPEAGYSLAGTALLYQGVPYRNGGSDPSSGFDCSGLVWYVYAQHGRRVPRTVAELFRAGVEVDPANLQAGDLVFFDTTGSGPSHVGIALGGDRFVHAPNSRGEVRVERLEAAYWASRLVGIRRMD